MSALITTAGFLPRVSVRVMTKLHPRWALLCVASLLTLIAPQSLSAGDHKILHLDELERGELICRSFEVSEPLEVDIYAVGSGWSGSSQLAGYAWIIRSGELEPVWIMESHNTDEITDQPQLREYDSSLELEPGTYEVYFYAGSPFGPGKVNIQLDDLGDLYEFMVELMSDEILEDLREAGEDLEEALKDAEESLKEAEKNLDQRERNFRESKREYYEELKQWEVEHQNRLALTDKLVHEYLLDISTDSDGYKRAQCSYDSDRAIAEILNPKHNLYSAVGFSCSEPLEVEVEALGEYSEFDRAFVDHGWLVDAGSRQRIWSMNQDNTRYAGGDVKNRGVRTTLPLPAGDYLVYYVTDGSHSAGDFNAAPPYNPQAYGIRVSVEDIDELQCVKPYRDTFSESAVIAITQVGDNICERRSFKLAQPCDLRIYAIGEFVRGTDDFCDYAWIERAGAPRTYWQMTEDNTRHAGGADKNRLFDDIVHFEGGIYTVGYVTDGSHSYGAFNAAAPFDQKNYGVSIYTLPDGCQPQQIIEVARPDQSDAVLARLTCIGDDAEMREEFKLEKPTRVRVYALGEGSGNSMYDYGWLKRTKDGQIVWEMTYRKTHPAGGAEKNRMVDDVLMLDAGDYEVWYVSDGSHSFASWNAPKPRDPQSWGITILKADQ